MPGHHLPPLPGAGLTIEECHGCGLKAVLREHFPAALTSADGLALGTKVALDFLISDCSILLNSSVSWLGQSQSPTVVNI